MRKKNYFIILIFFIVLIITGCKPKEKDQKIVFKEPEGYVFDSDLFLNHFEGAEARCLEAIPYFENGSQYNDANYEPSLDIAKNIQFQIKDTELAKILFEANDCYVKGIFETEGGYRNYSAHVIKNIIVPGPYLINNHYEFRFYKCEDSYQIGGEFCYYGYYTNIVESNGCYAYFLTNGYTDRQFDIFYLLTHTTNLPYEIYFENRSKNEEKPNFYIYLIPKDESFSKKCLLSFMEKETIHYYDIELMQEKMKGLSFNELNNG